MSKSYPTTEYEMTDYEEPPRRPRMTQEAFSEQTQASTTADHQNELQAATEALMKTDQRCTWCRGLVEHLSMLNEDFLVALKKFHRHLEQREHGLSPVTQSVTERHRLTSEGLLEDEEQDHGDEEPDDEGPADEDWDEGHPDGDEDDDYLPEDSYDADLEDEIERQRSLIVELQTSNANLIFENHAIKTQMEKACKDLAAIHTKIINESSGEIEHSASTSAAKVDEDAT